MNVTPDQLAAQYRWASAEWPFIHAVEAAHGLPPFLLYAVGSRETNLDEHYVTHPGDGGHGRGLWQLDDRSWEIPDPFPVELQAERAAAFLRELIDAEGGELLYALNRYNSGSPRTERTTGGDYGPDVIERRDWLAAHYPTPAPARPKENPTMYLALIDADVDEHDAPGGPGGWYLCGDAKRLWVRTGEEVDAARKAGVPDFGQFNSAAALPVLK